MAIEPVHVTAIMHSFMCNVRIAAYCCVLPDAESLPPVGSDGGCQPVAVHEKCGWGIHTAIRAVPPVRRLSFPRSLQGHSRGGGHVSVGTGQIYPPQSFAIRAGESIRPVPGAVTTRICPAQRVGLGCTGNSCSPCAARLEGIRSKPTEGSWHGTNQKSSRQCCPREMSRLSWDRRSLSAG